MFDALTRENRMTKLYDLLRDATRRSDVNGVIHVIFRGVREVLGVTKGMVVQHNPEKGILGVKIKSTGQLQGREDLLSTSREPVSALLEVHEAIIRTQDEEMFFVNSKSQVVVPIPASSRQVGLLLLEGDRPDTFDKAGIDFVTELVEQSSAVIRTLSSTESSQKELAVLWDVKRRIVTPTDMDVTELNALLGKILQLALARTNTVNGIIFMADEKTGELVSHSKAVLGNLVCEVPQRLKRRETEPSGIVFWVLDNNKPYMSSNTKEDSRYVPMFKGIRSHLSVPISFQDRCIGVIVVESLEPNVFTLEGQQALEELSHSVTILVRRAQLYEATKKDKGGRGIMIRGLSPEWEDVERRVERAAATNALVILRGESGTGKELLARSIHFNSKRRDKKLIVVNSAAIPDQLLESSLFGHVKGAFTDAFYDRIGEFEKADGGTIFLDEIGDLSLPLQSKILRVLETGEIQKVGSNLEYKVVDVRVICATSRNLEEMITKNEFREDLYYRLNVVPIWLPPLRDYKKSIPGMVQAFIREASKEFERPVEGISVEALDLLMRHDYSGNVRELKNTIEQAVIMSRGKNVTMEDLPKRLVKALQSQNPEPGCRDFKSIKRQKLERFEREYLIGVMTEATGNISKASDVSGINRVNFYKLLKRHDIEPGNFR